MASDFEALTAALEKITQSAERLAQIDEIARQVERLADAQQGAALADEDELKPDRCYRYAKVAEFLGCAKGTVQNASEAELPRCGGAYILGVDIMAFRGEVTYDEAAAYKRHRRRRVTGRLPNPASEMREAS